MQLFRSYKNYIHTLTLTILSLWLGILQSIPITQAASPSPTADASSIPCTGVLVSGCAQNMSFGQYLEAILKEIIPLLLFLAMIMIAWSGVQYMLSGFRPEQAGKAKQRIIGILVGAIFLLAVGVIANWISPDLKVDRDDATSTAPSASKVVAANTKTTVKAGQSTTPKDKKAAIKTTATGTIQRKSTTSFIGIQKAHATNDLVQSGDLVQLDIGDVLTFTSVGEITPDVEVYLVDEPISPTPSPSAGPTILRISTVDAITQKPIAGTEIYLTGNQDQIYLKGKTTSSESLDIPINEIGYKVIKTARSGYQTCLYATNFYEGQSVAMTFSLTPGSSDDSHKTDCIPQVQNLTSEEVGVHP